MDTAENCTTATVSGRVSVVEVRGTESLERGLVASALGQMLGSRVRVRNAENVVSAEPVDVLVDLRHVGSHVVVSVSRPDAATAPLDLLDCSVSLDELVRLIERAAGVMVRPLGTRGADGALQVRHVRSLTDRELEVLQQLRSGHCNKVIAANLGISVHTVRSHVENIMKKTGARTRVKAVTVVN